jgi:hypothetical protein
MKGMSMTERLVNGAIRVDGENTSGTSRDLAGLYLAYLAITRKIPCKLAILSRLSPLSIQEKTLLSVKVMPGY